MSIGPKQQAVLDFVTENKKATVAEVAKAFTEETHTVRNLLEHLRRKGYLKKHYTPKLIKDCYPFLKHTANVVTYEPIDR